MQNFRDSAMTIKKFPHPASKGCKATLVLLALLLAAGGAIAVALSDKIGRTWASYYRQNDFCVARNSLTTDDQRIASAIEHLRTPAFRQRVSVWSNGAIDTYSPIDPRNCCHVVFRGLHGEYAVNFWGVWRNEATAAVYIDSLPAHPVTKKHLHVLTDACGDAYEWGD